MRLLSNKTFLIIFIGILSIFLCFKINDQISESSTLFAGACKINITPFVPIPMSGYGGRDEAFKGVHDSLYVTATAFSDGSQKSVIITADLIGFSHDFCESTINEIESVTGIEKNYILLSANHNHGGPRNKTYGENTNPDVDNYVDELQQKIVKAVTIANANLQPASIGIGVGSCNMNINRRARFADGNIWLGRNPDGPCDHDVAVIRIDDLDGNPLALHVNWPCHGTASGQENYQITGDWPGLTARFVEKHFDEEVIVSVTAGASADINPIYGPNDNFREIESLGMIVGEEVLKISKNIQTFPSGNIEAVKKKLMAEGKQRFESRAPNQKLVAAEPVPINLSAMKIGNIVFAGVSGELMTEIGMKIKDESPYKNTIIITHCDGASGYLCTDQAYPEGGYEAMVSRVMPGTEHLISNNLKEMIRSLR